MDRDGRGMRWLALPGWLILLPTLVMTGMRFAPSQSWSPAAQVVGLFPLVAPAALLAVLLLLLGRRWWAAAVAGLLVVTAGAVLAPRMIDRSSNDIAAEQIRVGAANAYFGRADPIALAEQIAELELDVVCISEATPSLEADLARAGTAEMSAVSAVREGAGGTLLLSRLPVRELPEVAGSVFRMPRAAVTAPGGEVTVTCAHPVPPVRIDIPLWTRELTSVADVAAATDGPQIVMGDFNATWDHRLLRQIADRGGLRHVANTAGAGLAPTWPMRGGPLPFPFVAIDHILTDLEIHDSGALEIPGTDHGMVTGVLSLSE